MDNEYLVTFVFSFTTVTYPVITHHTDDFFIANLAIEEILRETGMDVSGANWEVQQL